MIAWVAGLAQPNTEIYLADVVPAVNDFKISNLINVSNDPGYDNQPSFQSNNILLFAGNNEGQTDIAQYHIKFKNRFWYHKGSASSQYSPQRIPNSQHVLSVHLDSTGRQRLYHHHITTGVFEEAHPELQVAYFTLYDENTLVGSVLADNGLDMVVVDLKTKAVDTLFHGAGRSFHKIPNTKAVSYTLRNEEGNFDIYQLDMETFDSFFVTQLPIGVQDHIWINETTLLLGSGDKLFLYDLFGNGDWQLVADLSSYQITDITRLALSPDGKKLALVALPKADTEIKK
jgi:hypothetical protein